ncbi:hypothetical protein LXL04_009725 [Taraxacum kok-saghyz]
MVVISEIPEGSSSSSSTHVQRYDVFLSFRGVDTRHSFTDHLYNALIDANITTFLADEEMETGEVLKPELESAIKESQASIIVLSKNYATSSWCLDELVLILEQHMTSNHIVIPVFYHVEPTHVRKQQDSFGDAIAKSSFRRETEFIEDIVKDIYRRLPVPVMSAQSLLFGIDHQLNVVTSWLKDGSSHKVDILTILGVGGIGKTSLAKHVFRLHCREFHSSSCIEDISRRCDGNSKGLLDIQKQLCDDISKTSSIQIHDVSTYTSRIENLVSRKRVFLVLDDVDTIHQLDALLGSISFHPGSKIIVTTKDKWLTKSCALFKTNIKHNHVELLLQGLHKTESLQLLCLHAFTCKHPKAGYEEVSNKLVKFCQGHPLALEVLGKSLHNQDVCYWDGFIEGLKKETNSPINNVLRMSFVSLPSKNDKKLFKYIACYFVGTDKDDSETILEACDINTRSWIKNLIDRCLLNIGQNNELKMHQLVQEMGRFEVHQESPEKPWKRSLLWSHKDSLIVLKRKMDKGNVKGLALDIRMLEKENSVGASFELKTDALSNMDSLELLQLNYVRMNGSYENFPMELKSLCMHGFCLKSIPSDLPMEHLVALDMSYSNIESFIGCFSDLQRVEKTQNLELDMDRSCLKGKRLFRSLKILNLSFCEQLSSLGDFDQLPALVKLIVRNCINLVEICESIEQCVDLVVVDLRDCKKLQKLPRNVGMLKKVKTMLLDGCNLGGSQIQIKYMDSLELCKANNTITSSSAFVGDIPCDVKFFAISLPLSLVSLSLAFNSLSTESFPMDFSYLCMLKKLYLDGNPIDSMPSCVRTLPRLELLSMGCCKKLKSVEYPPRTLKDLWLYSGRKPSIEKIVFSLEMSPLSLSYGEKGIAPGTYEIEGMIKIQPIVNVKEKVLRSLGWTNLDFLNERRMGTNSSESQIQMYYQFGIFSIVYEQEEMPNWITHRNEGSSISFTIPSSPNKLRGLNFCCMHASKPHARLTYPYSHFPFARVMTIRNVTKNHTWIYDRHPDRRYQSFWVLLSHWMFGMNEMEAGDLVTITVTDQMLSSPKECGVSIVYDDGEEEDALGYYKTWNHIIGGDLSPFQTTTGEYILSKRRFYVEGIGLRPFGLYPYPDKFIVDDAKYQEWQFLQDPDINPDIKAQVRKAKGSSSSSSTHAHRYDVFISFRGVDTRHSFTDHLYNALIDANITTFLDDEEIETGEVLKPELENAIKSSQASIIVLSKNYATSSWCLDELVLILEQCITSNHIVIPVFYHVEPTHVRKQQDSFGAAMAKYKQTMEEETDANKKSQWAQKIDRWTKALTKVADLKGKDVKGRRETEFIEEIVKEIHHRLPVPVISAQSLLFGISHHLNFVTKWLKDGSSHKADILTILGVGGIGKTSLAKHVFRLHCREFQSSSCIEDISRRCDGKFNGLLDVQKQLCDDISKPSSIIFHDVSTYTSKIENLVSHKRVFLVLDDVDTIDQLDALLGNKGFHPGSKIIITTKNAWLTKSCALFKTNIKPNHVELLLQGLDKSESLQLLCLHAFTCKHPKAGYEEVSNKLQEYCQGHPLALEVLGKSLHNQDVCYWEGFIEGLKKETDSRINNVLRMSFISLPSTNDKKLFKYISCYFVGTDKDVSETILEACGITTKTGIKNLIDRCLLNIGRNNKLEMHQLVQEMGRFEVHQESPEKPWKRSLLWYHEDSLIVLERKMDKGNVKGLALDIRMLEKENSVGASFELKTDTLSNMDSLELLQLNYARMNGSYQNFPMKLKSLCMHGFCLKSIPSDLPMEYLVALDMSYSNIQSFVGCYSYPQRIKKFVYSWVSVKLDMESCLKGKSLLPSLKILNLSFCEQLRSVGDFDQFPALERLIARSCINLVEVCESIEQCVELVLIDLRDCYKLEKLPRNIGMLKKVKTMVLDGCNIGGSQNKIKYMDSVELCKANKTITSSSAFVGDIPRDVKLFAISLPASLVSLSLAYNSLSTESFPMDLSCLSMLKDLYLDGNPMDSMPSCVRTLPQLDMLSMKDCKKLKSVERPPHTLRWLVVNPDRKSLLEKIVFDIEMSPLLLLNFGKGFAPAAYEIEGMFKIQPMVDVKEKVLHSLGWTNLDFLNKRRIGTNSSESEIQMYYEFGIFSTMYEQDVMPSWFRQRIEGPSISFTIPSSPNKLRGLNFCSMHTIQPLVESFPLRGVPFPCTATMMAIRNVTKNHTWIYERHRDRRYKKCWVLLSHWMFGMNEMEAGDHVAITVRGPEDELTKECGVSLVYDDDDDEDEEDALGYYKSWNHIIGGDLSPFQISAGPYLLTKRRFFVDSLVSRPFGMSLYLLNEFLAEGYQEIAKLTKHWSWGLGLMIKGTIIIGWK